MRAWPKWLAFSPTDKRYALLEAAAIGCVSALAALALKGGINWMGTIRLEVADTFGALSLPLMGLAFGWLAGLWLDRFSLDAKGGGIPQVKAALAQFPMSLSLRVALVKLAGTILILSSGLALGRRGPTVHIGAALAAQLSAWVPTSPEHRRQMIAAGAAAGLAAGFNTPIAGIFFVVEELSRDVSSLTLETAILASFVGAVVSRLLDASAGFDLNFAISSAPEAIQTSFNGRDLPFLILLGILAGFLGAAFNRGVLESLKFYRRLGWSMAQRIALAGAISGMLVAILPPFYRNYAGLRDLLLTEIDDWQTTAIALVAQFLLTIVAYGSGAPGGLFAPALLLGASLGELLGIAKVGLVGTGVAYPYALVGMGAFFTAVVRAPVTAIVIVFELTADFNLVLPLMIVSVVAYAIAESIFSGSLYQHLLAINGIRLQDDTDNAFLAQLTAADIMQSKVETLSLGLSLDEVRQAFLKKPHRGFPIVEDGALLGLITQVDVARMAAHPGWIPLRDIVTPRPVSIAPSATAREALYLLNRYHISHLPVADTDGHLLGIVTRTDIIRTEARLRFEGGETLTRYSADIEPVAVDASYVVYQTRSPRVGKGRILVALANPKTAALLLLFAGGMARRRNAELECLQITIVPRHQEPSETWVDLGASRELLAAAEALGRGGEVPVHTQIRTAHDAIATLLEAIAERQISLLVLGWRVDGGASLPGSNIAANALRQVPCDVVLVKPGKFLASLARRPSTRWLVSFEGNASHLQRSLQLLPALSTWTPQLEVWLVQVFLPDDEEPELAPLEAAAAKLRGRLPANSHILTIPARANSNVEAIVRLANSEGCDVIVLGTTREGLLQQAIHGNAATAIARQVDATTILVRGALE